MDSIVNQLSQDENVKYRELFRLMDPDGRRVAQASKVIELMRRSHLPGDVLHEVPVASERFQAYLYGYRSIL